MFYNQAEFEELLAQSAPLGIDIAVIDSLLKDFPELIEPSFSAIAENLLKRWKSILVFELMSPFWFLDSKVIDLAKKHQIAAAAVKTSMAIKILDDLEDVYSESTHYPFLYEQCFAWWEECKKNKLNSGDFSIVFGKWRKFSKDETAINTSRAEILSSKSHFMILFHKITFKGIGMP